MFLGNRQVCTLTAHRSTCSVLPTGADVGIQALRAVITDLGRQHRASDHRVEVPRFAAQALTVATKSANRPRDQALKTITARSCCPPSVARPGLRERLGHARSPSAAGKIIDDSQVALNGSCKVTKKITATRTGKNEVLRALPGSAATPYARRSARRRGGSRDASRVSERALALIAALLVAAPHARTPRSTRPAARRTCSTTRRSRSTATCSARRSAPARLTPSPDRWTCRPTSARSSRPRRTTRACG